MGELTTEQWNNIPAGRWIQTGDQRWVLKCVEVSEETEVIKSVGPPEARLRLHRTRSNRLMGYTFDHRLKHVLQQPAFLWFVHSPLEATDPVRMIHQDRNLRLLSFGKSPNRDFLLIDRRGKVS